MKQLMVNGGFGMFPILIFGLVALASAAWFAVRAEGRVRGFLEQLGRAVLYMTLTTIATDLMTVCFNVHRFPAADRGLTIVQGVGESLSPAVMGFALLGLVHLLTAIGQRRLDARQG